MKPECAGRIRVLIVDDSALVRAVLQRAFNAEADFEVIATAANAYAARDILVQHRPDLITLDIHMPRLDGLSFLKKLTALMPTPTVVFSTAVGQPETDAELIRAGAGAVVKKSSGEPRTDPNDPVMQVIEAARRLTRRQRPQPAAASALATAPSVSSHVIGIGASTGGVAALRQLLPSLPAGMPAIVIVQHMPEGFTDSFARRMNEVSAVTVREALDGEHLLTSHVYVAPGGQRHCEVMRSGSYLAIRLVAGPPERGHRPSVDRLFMSLAASAGSRSIGCLLTGMGSDGAAGLLRMRRAGAATIAQAKADCAVWGMPGAAVALGAAGQVVPLASLSGALQALCNGENGAAARGSLAPSR